MIHQWWILYPCIVFVLVAVVFTWFADGITEGIDIYVRLVHQAQTYCAILMLAVLVLMPIAAYGLAHSAKKTLTWRGKWWRSMTCPDSRVRNDSVNLATQHQLWRLFSWNDDLSFVNLAFSVEVAEWVMSAWLCCDKIWEDLWTKVVAYKQCDNSSSTAKVKKWLCLCTITLPMITETLPTCHKFLAKFHKIFGKTSRYLSQSILITCSRQHCWN